MFASLVRRRLVLVIEGDCICILVQLSMENFFLVETISVLCPKCLMPYLQGDGLIDALEFWWTSLRTSSYLRIPWASTSVKKEPTLPCWDRYRIDKTFASICAKNYVYFSIKIYLFILHTHFFKTLHIRLFILHYILLRYQFLKIFLIVYLSSYTIITIYALPSYSAYIKK